MKRRKSVLNNGVVSRCLERPAPLDHVVPSDDVGQIAIHVFLCDYFDTRVDDPRQRNTQ